MGTSLTSVTIPSSVNIILQEAFFNCPFTAVYFKGDAPANPDPPIFSGGSSTTMYHLPGTFGWGSTFDNSPTAIWQPWMQTGDAALGALTNEFRFNIIWASGMAVVVEACTNLGNPIWVPIGTNTLASDSSYFSDPQWTNCPARFYRLRSP